ncbi:CdaR family protein [bacterium]|jgi:YbbR domain-containing protein|nr:CdaR family protein [bacterium]
MRDFFTKNIWTKILSVIFAVIVWFYVAEMRSVKHVAKIPLRFIPPANLAVVDSSADVLRVTFSGTAEEVQSLENYDLEAVHKIPDSQDKGRVLIKVAKSDISKPIRVSVVNIEPKIVDVALDEQIEKKLIVRPVWIGQPAYGYEIADASSTPREVSVLGPEKLLSSKRYIETLPIDVTGKDKSFAVRVPLEPLIKDDIYKGEKVVVVSLEIKEALSQRRFEQLPVNILTSSSRKLSIRIEPVSVAAVVSGPQNILDKMGPQEISLFIEVLEKKKGVYELPVKADLPKNVFLERTEPEAVEVTINGH